MSNWINPINNDRRIILMKVDQVQKERDINNLESPFHLTLAEAIKRQQTTNPNNNNGFISNA